MKENTEKLIEAYNEGGSLKLILKTLTDSQPVEVIVFLKKTSYLDNRSSSNKLVAFWKSDVHLVHFKSLIQSDLKELLLHSFFSSKRFISKNFLLKLADFEPESFIKYSRLSKSFLKYQFITLYEENLKNHRNIELRNLFFEFNYLYKRNREWNTKETEIINGIKHYPLEDILIQTTSFLEIYKRSDYSHLDNLSNLISFSCSLKMALNRLLTKLDFSETQPNYQSLDIFNQYYQSQLPPINPVKDAIANIFSPKEIISEQKKKIRGTLIFLMDKLSFQFKIDNYAVGFADFEFIDDMESELSQNKDFIQHRRNVKKYTYTRDYHE